MTHFLKSRFVKDTAVLQVSRIGIMGLTFVASVVVIRLLGVAAYGTLSLAQALFATLQTFNLLTPGTGAQTLLSMAHAARNDSEILRVLGHSLKMGMIWSVICLIVLGLFGSP